VSSANNDGGDETTPRISGESGGSGTGDERSYATSFDPEELNVTWSDVRPDVDDVEGSRIAEDAGRAVRELLYPYLKSSSALDGVQPMIDLDGNPYVWLRPSAAATLELLDLARVGLRLCGDLVGEA
jgi:hypothetical protein